MSTTVLKKTPSNETTESYQQTINKCYELDELYWFIEKKPRTEARENIYLMTAISREPRQIVGFEVRADKRACHIQKIVDSIPFLLVEYLKNPALHLKLPSGALLNSMTSILMFVIIQLFF